MFRRSGHSHGRILAAASLIVLVACSGGDDDDEDTGGRDGGIRDTGVTARDAGPDRDAGFPDVGPRPDGGHYCAPNDEVQVDGVGVPVDPIMTRPMTEFGQGLTSCIDDPIEPQPQPFEMCLFNCLDFMGFDPTPADVAALRLAVFPAVDDMGDPVDPSYDRMTGMDRQPSERLDVGANFRAIDTGICASGWAVEVGFSDLGPSSMFGEVHYSLRVTSSTASSAWVDTYYPSFIRRNSSTDVSGSNCSLSLAERTSPNLTYDFIVGARSLIGMAASGAGVTIPGSADLGDGMGTGYALIEARDCSGVDGRDIANATAGFAPEPLESYYPSDTYDLARRERYTDQAGRYLAVGFAGMAATSSLAEDVRFGVGISRDGTCTEEYGGGTVAIHPDGLSVVRANVETIVHGD